MPELAVATFNLHAGIDGWGAPFEVAATCALLDADVILLQETWTPEDGEGIARGVARALGYEVHEVQLADALMLRAIAPTRRQWGPYRGDPLNHRRLWVNDSGTLARLSGRPWADGAASGTWGIALLSRLPVMRAEVIDLGRLRRDQGKRRAALLAVVEVEGCPITVVGTHLAHFTHGSPLLLERLRRRLPPPDQPGVLAGDMNFWGPPLSLALPGWKRAVRARSYPSWRAHSQIDHIFVTRAVELISGEALRVGNSDHWPLRAQVAFSGDRFPGERM